MTWLAVAGADLAARARVAATAARRALIPLVATDTLLVFGSPDLRHIGAGSDDLVVIGTLFGPNGDRAPIAKLDVQEVSQICAGTGRRLIDHYWGSYVALGQTTTGQNFVLRDPSGAQPLNYRAGGGFIVLASGSGLLFEADHLTPSIAWDQIARTLAYRDLRDASTCLAGISELLPGQRMLIDRTGRMTTRCLWSPWDFIELTRHLRRRTEQIQAVHQTVRHCVESWQIARGPVLVELSGGLDSSVIAAALDRAATSAITYAYRSADMDERRFAQAAAQAAGIPLAEAWVDPARIAVGRSAARDLARPAARLFAQELDRLGVDRARQTGARTFFNGGGGDNVFAHLQSAAPVADHLRAGSLFGALSTARDVSRANRSDMRTVIRRTLHILRNTPNILQKPDLRFLKVDPGPLAHDNPWLEVRPGLAPGKRLHVRNIIHVLNHSEGYGRADHAPVIFPLMSQPIVELCLSIPSWSWIENGIDRSLARDAFRDRLSPVTATRRTKGGVDGFIHQIFKLHRSEIRDMLLGGRLVTEGIVDAATIEPLLGVDAVLDDYRLMALVDIEAWAAAWSGG